MDSTTFMLVLSFFLLSCLYLLKQNHRNKKIPPGPHPLPIIGNLHQLGKIPTRTLTKLAKTYGPLMSLQLGSVYTVVASSPEMVKEILQKHDHLFSSRITTAATEAHDHDKFSLTFLPVGKRWTNLRRICKEQMFSNHRLDASIGLRRDMLHKLLEYVHKCCIDGRVINIREIAFNTALNLMSNTLFSLDIISDFDSHTAHELKEAIEGVVHVIATPNIADLYPVLRRLDPQGIKRKSEAAFGKLLDMFEKIINKRLESRGECPKKQDMLESLLDLKQAQGNNYDLSIDIIKHLFLDLFVAGSDTNSTTVEWVMTELLINPNSMSKAKAELRTYIGEYKQVEESDISKLPYLQAIIKETFRLHPPGPLLVPHKALHEVEINGYTIPKDTQILVNVWALGRYPVVWSNPDSFEPERFLDNGVDYNGQDLQFIPFGSGRRSCPGLPMAHRTVHLMVANLIHNFNWKLEPGMKQDDLNTNEKLGLALHKEVPLECVPMKP